MPAPFAYLDYAATAPIDAAAVAAMSDAATRWANPSSVHRAGRAAHAALEDARESIAAHFACAASALVFTSGGTEALGLALCGTSAARILISAVEHDAVRAQAAGATVIPVDRDGRIDLDALATLLAGQPALVAVMQVNNETGVLQPLAEVAALTHAAGGRLLVDAVQGAGKIACPYGDFVAVSAHKLGGPPGVGALIVRCAEDLVGVQRGGGQERGFRAGTENLPGIAGFAAALAARAEDTGWLARTGALRDRLETRLLATGALVNGAGAPRLPTISNIAMPGVAASTQVMAFDLAGFAVSAGAACSSGKVTASHVLAAMQVAPAIVASSIRISHGWRTTEAEIDGFVAAWQALRERHVARAA